jgi:hypothetical protein
MSERRTTLATVMVVAMVTPMVVDCVGPGDETDPLLVSSVEAFAEHVQPELGARCASGGCHGVAMRPLALYAPGALRADPLRLHLDEPLTWTELENNAARVAAFAHGQTVTESLVLRKPLAVIAGGCYHGGGDVFADRQDPGYEVLRSWLSTRGDPQTDDGGPR